METAIKEKIVGLAAGNPGALRVLCELTRIWNIDTLQLLKILDDHGIIGPKVWIGYKDCCGEDIETFSLRILEADADFFDRIDRISKGEWPQPEEPEEPEDQEGAPHDEDRIGTQGT